MVINADSAASDTQPFDLADCIIDKLAIKRLMGVNGRPKLKMLVRNIFRQTMSTIAKKEIQWTPRLIRELRSGRTQAEFGALIGATKNLVLRWETNKAQPDATFIERLSDLAERERFLKDWKLVGSIRLLDDLETAKPDIDDVFRKSLENTARQLAE